jgi:hypothetical protein
MVRNRLLAVAIAAALLIPRTNVLARVGGDGKEKAIEADSSNGKSGSESVLNDLFAAPVVRDLIARGVLGGLGAAYDFSVVGDTQLVVFVNHGAGDSGVSYLNIAKAELPGVYRGSRVSFIPTPIAENGTPVGGVADRYGKISNRDILQAQQGLLRISTMPGVREQIKKRVITSIFVDYSAPPPELCVTVERYNASSLEDAEGQVPASLDGLPVLVTYDDHGRNSAIGHWGERVDPTRPGRTRPTKLQ